MYRLKELIRRDSPRDRQLEAATMKGGFPKMWSSSLDENPMYCTVANKLANSYVDRSNLLPKLL
jgi:hypothetical protein